MDMRSQSQENTNQKTKVSIFHVITAIAFCCLMTQRRDFCVTGLGGLYSEGLTVADRRFTKRERFGG